MTTLLAIDPSINNTGIAVFQDGIVIEVDTMNGYKLAIYLHENLARFGLVAMEDSRLQKACFNKHYKSVGQVDAVCNIVEQAIQEYNKKNKKNKIIFETISPLQKGRKIPKEYIQEEYPQLKITQDISDAIKVGKIILQGLTI